MSGAVSHGEQMDLGKTIPIELGDLRLDPLNPRLAEYGVGPDATQPDLVKVLWEKMAVAEVAMSIAYSGYFPYEPIFVEPTGRGKFVVIEGNRRLAAVLLLTDPELRNRLKATDLPKVSGASRHALDKLPAIITTRKEIWRYLGFKHVNGPATWGSYAKAQYIAHVHNDYGVPLNDIAAQIGDYNSTVTRMYRGLMIIEQAEKAKLFDRKNIAKESFYFNYIYTGMDYPGISNYIGLSKKDGAIREPVPKGKQKNLGKLLTWLYGSSSGSISSLIKSQNPDLKIFDAVLQSPEGIRALETGLPLSVAHDISLGDERLFRQSLQQAKQSLQRALGTLTTGFDIADMEAMKTAKDIESLAHDLVDGMTLKGRNRDRR